MLLRGLAVMAPGIAAFVVLWRRFPQTDGVFWAAVAAFLLSCLGCVVINLIPWKFKCPECGEQIRDRIPVERVFNIRVQFYCDRCDIIWDTGMTLNSTED